MKKTIVAIVGRPNVGKSTLFNRLCKKRSAIVDFESGITRDRKYEEVEWNGRSFVIVDTGGIVADSNESMDKLIRAQAELAIEEADWIVFLVDAKTGTTDLDMEIAKILRQHSQKVILVANKVDNEKDDLELYDFMQLGFGDPFPIAAASGRNTGNFLDELLSCIETTIVEDEEEVEDDIKVAIVGRPNVGKSSIVNRLLGEAKQIVTDVPGTTRDSIDSLIRYHNKAITLIDTAGLRRKTKVKYGVEYFSVMRTIDAVNRADVVVLILSADEEIANQELKIASYARRTYKDLILVVNKWDLPEKDNSTMGKFVTKIREDLAFVDYAPILFTSALTGQRVHKILDAVLQVEEESFKRIPTAELNKFLEKIVHRHSPSHPTGKHIRFLYCTQPLVHPPTFMFFSNDPLSLSEQYKRYVHNQLRDEFGFTGATIKLVFKGRGRGEDATNVEY